MPHEPQFRFFEPNDEFFVIERPDLPHWAQDGTMCFITWRTYDSWKHYTAVQINRQLEKRGRFWEVDGFDQLVRSEEQFEYYRRYIAENPRRARLRKDEFLHYSCQLQ